MGRRKEEGQRRFERRHQERSPPSRKEGVEAVNIVGRTSLDLSEKENKSEEG